MGLDSTKSDALAVCTRCPWRAGPYVDRTAARAVLARHSETVHKLEASAANEKARQRARRRVDA